MAATYNPYEAPGVGGYAPPPNVAAGGMITPTMVEHLRAARPWIRFISILLFIGTGFTVLAAALLFFAGVVGAALSSRSKGAELIAGPIGGVFYMVIGLFYALPGILMHRLANAIDSFVTVPSSQALEDALDKNRSYWKTTGIMALVMIGFCVLLFVGAFVVGIAAGLAAKP